MDISALSLVFGAQTEQTGQTPVAPGFELTLEQAVVDGFVPPGGPPGPEPPPVILVAGEGVEVLEPTAQPQKLDFLPQENTDLDIDLPKPFWESSIGDDLPVCPPAPEMETEGDSKTQPVDEAMEWLASQMVGGFFAAPVISSNNLDPASNPAPPVCPTRVTAANAQPVISNVDTGLIPLPTATLPEEVEEQSGMTSSICPTPAETTFEALQQQVIAPEIKEALNIGEVEVFSESTIVTLPRSAPTMNVMAPPAGPQQRA